MANSRIEKIFPSYICRGQLGGFKPLNRHLEREIVALEKIDSHGRKWSRTNYVGGYSSYSSYDQLHHTSPNFGDLEKKLSPHVRRFARSLNWDLRGRTLSMTTCWANSMRRGTHHTMHTHPLCVISGVYYVSVPSGSSPFKIEDPRMGFFMAAPPRRASAPTAEQNYILVPPRAGNFVLFESWMRHEVPPHQSDESRVCISFNYELA